ncbi:hypothetical protein [Clostridium luticellarii]|uniref:Uncharacterized protein n=1 Tax=Clostridium luticellarii TaxID=1691940 RepID=A0A2T0BQR6_9CLOT|nr:hypothetical protein [Clostridium luticellarii]MCI1945290.1 hypothetical protein [Clostridium luticellarii]MCI1968649.1 hypothetical protein [Clostridium luticellarii]MCI1995829.1 hypothetical protein [Clostridium luticellarii]MCI2040123.1 hypothetical protein [Clostridium luticellarii]PRR86221.1 hypothetical protein CLLU_08760 [Clostridium luticellarii]
MIFETNISIAVKNSREKYDIKNFSIFDINDINESFPSLKISFVNSKILLVGVKCGLCGDIHYYRYSINELIKKAVVIGGCEMLGFPILYIGNYDVIKSRISRHNEIQEKMHALV